MATKISQLKLENFTVFEHLDLQLAGGINVIAGENGAGKSHLLKILYTAVEAGRPPRVTVPISAESRMAAKLVNVFRPEALGRLVRRLRGHGRASVEVSFTGPRSRLAF